MALHHPETVEEKADRAQYMRAYRRGRRSRALKPLKVPEDGVEPCESLDTLLSLDVSSSDTIPRLARGLRWHVAYGTLTANAAAQIVRLAELELAATRKKPQGSPLAGRFAKAAGGGGKFATTGEVKNPEATTSPPPESVSAIPGSHSAGGEVSPESGQSEGAAPRDERCTHPRPAPSDSSACAEGRPSESQGACVEVSDSTVTTEAALLELDGGRRTGSQRDQR